MDSTKNATVKNCLDRTCVKISRVNNSCPERGCPEKGCYNRKYMKAHLEKIHATGLYGDGTYVMCNYCVKKCDKIIRCSGCGTTSLVFYDSRWDAFICPGCLYAWNNKGT